MTAVCYLKDGPLRDPRGSRDSLKKNYLWKKCVSVLPSTAGGVELDPVCGSSGLSSWVPRPSPHPLNAGWLSFAQCITNPFMSSLFQCLNKRY